MAGRGGDAIRSADGAGDEWGTPFDLWAEIHQRHFEGLEVFDPCPNRARILPGTIVTPEPSNGLEIPWDCNFFVNPPFSDIEPWIEKAMKHCGDFGVLLVPARTDQKWWRLAGEFSRVEFIQNRVNYINPETGTTEIIVRDKETKAVIIDSKTGLPKRKAGSTSFSSVLLIMDGKRWPSYWWPECHKNRKRRPLGETVSGKGEEGNG